MSNYTAQARTNYFAVKDVEALKADLRSYGIEPHPWSAIQTGAEFVFDDEKEGAIALFSYGTWPSLDEDAVADRLEAEPEEEVRQDHTDLATLIAAHLAEGQVAVFMQVGSEKLRYLGGTAVAINAAGESKSVDLEDIYDLARGLAGPGTTVTKAEY